MSLDMLSQLFSSVYLVYFYSDFRYFSVKLHNNHFMAVTIRSLIIGSHGNRICLHFHGEDEVKNISTGCSS